MQKSMLFWVLMLLWLVVGLWGFFSAGSTVAANYGLLGFGLVLFVLVGLLGSKVFGAPLQG